MRKHFEARLGLPLDATYQLTATITEERDAAAVTSDGDITRFSILGASTWELTKDGLPVAAGTVETFTSYAATGSTVATQAAEDAAVARLAFALADLVIADVLLADL